MNKIILSLALLFGVSIGIQAQAFPWAYPVSSGDQQEQHGNEPHKTNNHPQRPPHTAPGHSHMGPNHQYVPHPGYTSNFHYNYSWHPHWWHTGIRFPGFAFVVGIPAGYWQCTAFDQGLNPVSDYGPTEEQAAYAALYSCGGPNYQASGCYIPQGYCQPR